jgi:hypothetical protein
MMVRTGIIRSYNRFAKVGIIEDGNKQRIKFYANLDTSSFEIGDLVHFEINLSKNGLRAINVLNIIEINGINVNLS